MIRTIGQTFSSGGGNAGTFNNAGFSRFPESTDNAVNIGANYGTSYDVSDDKEKRYS